MFVESVWDLFPCTLSQLSVVSVSWFKAYIHTIIFSPAINKAIFHNLSNLLILVASEAACCKEYHNLTMWSWTIIPSCWFNISSWLCCEDPEQTVHPSHFPWPSSFHWPILLSFFCLPLQTSDLFSVSSEESCAPLNIPVLIVPSFSDIAVALMTSSR